ncbi:hypothetical protein ACFPK9_06295 [Rubritalea spongiae]|uniref:Cell division protein FtsL n=1 Tax=Rubritalea spongiae TaxID=430797 RepID=A0ABW5E3P2_9BACT
MNKKRSQTSQFSSIHIVMVIVVTALLATGGVLHAFIKNRMLVVDREIQNSSKRIEECEKNIEVVQMKISRELNRPMVRAELAARGSELKPIPSQAIEVVDSSTTSVASVAQTAP